MRSTLFDNQVGTEWIFDDSYQDVARAAIVAAFNQYDIAVNPAIYDDPFHDVFAELIVGKGVLYEGDEYTEQWFRFHTTNKNQVLDKLIAANPAAKRIERLGQAGRTALQNALNKIILEDNNAQDRNPEQGTISAYPEIPASDRIVTLDHNQLASLEAPIDEVIRLVEAENSIGGEDGLRELVLGRVRAGRELLRVGIFSVRSLQLTLIVGLQMLVDKYGDTAIAIVAAKLLDLLLAQYGLG
jgi:hypothetical protein